MNSPLIRLVPCTRGVLVPVIVALGLVTVGKTTLAADSASDSSRRQIALVLAPQEQGKDKSTRAEDEVAAAVAEASEDVREASETVRGVVSNALKEAGKAISQAAQVGRSVALSFRRGGTPWALVLPGDRLTTEQAENMTEDLAVMTKILRKSTRPGDAETGAWRVGPGFVGYLYGGSGPDALYLDGFGALFLISVDFPLVGPREASGNREEQVTDETWERTRRELREGGDPFDRSLGRNFRQPGEALVYREDRVNELRENLIDALKHATNLGGVPADETIAIAVFCPTARGDEANPAAAAKRKSRSAYSKVDDDGVWTTGAMIGLENSGQPGSVMGLRVRKSDVDAFAKGKIDRDAFAKKIQISTR
ncbi:MAG: hypothetical protein JNK85_08890 [Verrucomicrobiales bacterium]|nr:hypothetical protein [Verrucomicrobiales bacterium]